MADDLNDEEKKMILHLAAKITAQEKKAKQSEDEKTVDMIFSEYIDTINSVRSPSTIVGYDKIRRTAFPEIMQMKPSKLNRRLIQKAVNDYSKERKPKTVYNAYALLKMVLTFYGYGELFDGISLPQKIKPEFDVPDDNEIANLLEYTKGTRLYVYICLGALMGLRRSEIMGLTWENVDFKRNKIYIRHALIRNIDHEFVESMTKTTLSARDLDMPSPVSVALLELKRKSDGSGRVFNCGPNAIISAYYRMRKKYYFPYSFHKLRHYYASTLLKQGVPNKYAQERMGHATQNMLIKVYQHTFQDEQKAIDSKINTFFENLTGSSNEK